MLELDGIFVGSTLGKKVSIDVKSEHNIWLELDPMCE
jgi:hypothetical protein